MVCGRLVEKDLAAALEVGVEVDPGLHAKSRRSPRQITLSRSTAPRRKSARRMKNRIGFTTASHSPTGTIASSASEALQLVKGSGEALIAAREPALARCTPAASEPPRI